LREWIPKSLAGLAAAFVATALVAAGPDAALANHVACGDTITQDTTLDSNLIDCPGDGIVIGASDITLDLAGHSVTGSAIGYGIANGSYDRVTVRGGTVRDFAVGVGIGNVTDAALLRLRIRDSRGPGISLLETHGGLIEANVVTGCQGAIEVFAERIVITGNVFSGNTGNGIHAFDAGDNRIEQNIVSRNAGDGIHGFGMGSTLIERNVIAANGGAGISTDDGSTDNRIQANRIWDNAGTGVYMYAGAHENLLDQNSVVRNGAGGIYVGYGDGNEIRENRISRNGGPAGIVLDWANDDNAITANHVDRNSGDGIVLAGDAVTDNLVEANRVFRNGGDGIHLAPGFFGEGDSSGNVVRRNLALGNADDGVDVDSRLTTIARNIGVRNGDLGIEAVAGVTDGGGNRAAGNGNPLQCLNVFCR
jgi:parallel beta-helix repeat protein